MVDKDHIEKLKLEDIGRAILTQRLNWVLDKFFNELYERYGSEIPDLFVLSPKEIIRYRNIRVLDTGEVEVGIVYKSEIRNAAEEMNLEEISHADLMIYTVELRKKEPYAVTYISEEGLL